MASNRLQWARSFIDQSAQPYVFNSKIVHFSFVVHRFGMAIKGGCEAMVHDIRSVLDVHLNWVVLQVDVMKVFNSILHKAIF